VLVVEDDDAIAVPLALGRRLRREGFSVTRAATGAAALEEGIDVVLLDLGLPDVDGFEVCRRLRSRSDVPILVVSARGEEVDRVVALELGAQMDLREAPNRGIDAVVRLRSGGHPDVRSPLERPAVEAPRP